MDANEKKYEGETWLGGYTALSTHGEVEWDADESCDVLVNLTPHPVTIRDLGWPVEKSIPSHGSVRLLTEEVRGSEAKLVAWVPDCLGSVYAKALRYGEVSGDLPPALPNGEHYRVPFEKAEPGLWPRRPENAPRVWFLVSTLTVLALKGRHDVLAPGPEIRDASGRIVACQGLVTTVRLLEVKDW